MTQKNESGKNGIEVVCEALFDFAIDRRDVAEIMARFPRSSDARRATVEHELQILKIISVGWSLSYCMPAGDVKEEITTRFWGAVHDFSKSLSRTTELLIRQEIDFFAAVKGRFEGYLEEMKRNAEAPEPAVVIGPEFARCCGDGEDAHTVMAGSRMFVGAVNEVRRYLEEQGIAVSSLP